MGKNNKNIPVIIICSLLITTAFSCIFWIYSQYRGRMIDSSVPMTANLYQNGALIQSIPLDPKEPPYTITVMGGNGAYNTITVKEGKIGISAASCPDKLCMHQGYINNTLLPITCLPNKLVIRVRPMEESGNASGRSGSDFQNADVITY